MKAEPARPAGGGNEFSTNLPMRPRSPPFWPHDGLNVAANWRRRIRGRLG